MGELNVQKTLVGSPEGKRRGKCENNIKVNLIEKGGKLLIGFIRLGIGTCGGLLCEIKRCAH
jgi:hypothetical protein